MTTILVVDDSAVDRRIVAGLLEKESDWRIEFAENGSDLELLTEIRIVLQSVPFGKVSERLVDEDSCQDRVKDHSPLTPGQRFGG